MHISKKRAKESNKTYYYGKKSKINVRKRFIRLGMWMVAKKTTSTPVNPKSKVQNQGKEDQVKKAIPCVLGEERKIKRL